jgi:DNA-directed RNA polymerase subunit RPC12/RpoP
MFRCEKRHWFVEKPDVANCPICGTKIFEVVRG